MGVCVNVTIKPINFGATMVTKKTSRRSLRPKAVPQEFISAPSPQVCTLTLVDSFTWPHQVKSMHLCNFSVNRKLFQNTKVTREKGIHADGALDFPWISCMPEETRPLLQGLGASEFPFDCRHFAGPATLGASARHPHSRTLVAVPAASRPLIPAPGHGRHSRP